MADWRKYKYRYIMIKLIDRDFDDELLKLWREFKEHAHAKGLSIKRLLYELLSDYLEKEKQKQKAKK